MCGTCGCAADARIQVLSPPGHTVLAHGTAEHGTAEHSTVEHSTADDTGRPGDAHAEPDGHGPAEAHGHGGAADLAANPAPATGGRTIVLQQKVLAKNDRIAARNRDWLRARGILAINLMSSPGAGKTTLLERTAAELGQRLVISVIEGDQETALDAGRIKAAGCRVVQVNTGAGCHLDAAMVARALPALDPPIGSVVIIENVGNLVCPALFDLGEHSRVVMTSVTEGADKPAKYPQMFRAADVVLLNKVDLLPYVAFDSARHAADLARINPGAGLLPLSATSGQGLTAWYDWLTS
jgi:hydrogenase nickel incorporation protein HypB